MTSAVSCSAMDLLREIASYPGRKISVAYAKSMPPAKRALYKELLDANYLQPCDGYSDNRPMVSGFLYRSSRISDVGEAALDAYEKQLQKERQQKASEEAKRIADRAYADQNTKKQFRHDWRVAVFEVLGAFILGAIADHFFDIVGYADRLWSALFH